MKIYICPKCQASMPHKDAYRHATQKCPKRTK